VRYNKNTASWLNLSPLPFIGLKLEKTGCKTILKKGEDRAV